VCYLMCLQIATGGPYEGLAIVLETSRPYGGSPWPAATLGLRSCSTPPSSAPRSDVGDEVLEEIAGHSPRGGASSLRPCWGGSPAPQEAGSAVRQLSAASSL